MAVMPTPADAPYPDSVAILSVWVQVKDGGVWGARGPPPWVIKKHTDTTGTLLSGSPDQRTVDAFRDARITIAGLEPVEEKA